MRTTKVRRRPAPAAYRPTFLLHHLGPKHVARATVAGEGFLPNSPRSWAVNILADPSPPRPRVVPPLSPPSRPPLPQTGKHHTVESPTPPSPSHPFPLVSPVIVPAAAMPNVAAADAGLDVSNMDEGVRDSKGARARAFPAVELGLRARIVGGR